MHVKVTLNSFVFYSKIVSTQADEAKDYNKQAKDVIEYQTSRWQCLKVQVHILVVIVRPYYFREKSLYIINFGFFFVLDLKL